MTPVPHHPPVAPATPDASPDSSGDAVAARARATVGRATGVVMALVPCTGETAHRVLVNAARAAGVPPHVMAQSLLETRGHHEGADPALAQALRTAIDHARTAPTPLPVPAAGLLPAPFVLRQHLNHLRAARRRFLAAPDDPTLRADLEDATYTLCVLMGQRSAHAAILAAEEVTASHRLPPTELAEPNETTELTGLTETGDSGETGGPQGEARPDVQSPPAGPLSAGPR